MSAFDPDVFLNASVEGEMDTKRLPVPVSQYPAMIDKITVRTTKNDGKVLGITWWIQDAELEQSLGRDKVTVQGSIFLDFDDQGRLDRSAGKNVMLGQLREALGQNGPGPWAPNSLVGAGPCLISVTQRPNPEDAEEIFNDVKKFAPMA